MAKILLIETLQVRPSDVSRVTPSGYIAESIGGKLIVTLPATTCDKKNLNERVYSSSVMESVCNKSKNAFESRELLSSVNEHPSEPYVTPGQASHVVTDAWVKDGIFYNKWEILETATGRDLRALIEAGVSFGVSIRGLGSMDYQGNILEDYEFCGTDCVAEPSAQLRVRPNVVKENKSPSDNFYDKTKESKMKDKNSVLKYISEQKVLMESEIKGDKVAAFKRAAAVEDILAESTLQGKELAEVFTVWEGVKNSCFKNLVESKGESDDVDAQVSMYRKVIEKRNTQLNVMGKALTKMTEQLNATKRLTQKKIVEAVTTVNGKAKTSDSQLRAAMAENKALKVEVAKLKKLSDGLLAEATIASLSYKLAVKEASRINIGYKIAVKEAAKLAKGKKLIIVKEASDGKQFIKESLFAFFSGVDYETYAGAGRPFGKMEPMISEGSNYTAILAGTDDSTTQVQVFTEDGKVWAKDVAAWNDFYAFASQIPETVTEDLMKEYGFTNIGSGPAFNESKAKSFKTVVTESSKVINNSGLNDKKEVVEFKETAHTRGEVPHAGWI
jgi:hypothetical protein